MRILLIGDKNTESDIYSMIDQILAEDKVIESHDIDESPSYLNNQVYDLIFINYNSERIENGDFQVIFEVRCKTQAPMLVIMAPCGIRDKLHVLNMRADDYIERPINKREFKEKILLLLNRLPWNT